MFDAVKIFFTGYGHSKVLERGVFLAVLMVVVPTSTAFSVINAMHDHIFLAWFLAAVSVVTTLLLYFGRKDMWLPYFEYVLMFLSCLAFTSIFMAGGIAQTGIYWTLIFPFFAFILMGVKKGWWWIACFIFIQLDVVVLFNMNMIALPYSQEVLWIVSAMFLFFTFIASVFELQNEKGRSALMQANAALNNKEEDLLEAYSNLENQVFQRTRELQESNTQLISEMKHKELAIASMQHTELKFQHAQRMESVGTLVGGIAHDFNNMLSGITANLYMAKRQMQSENGRDRLDKIDQLALHAADMIKQLLTFARKDGVVMADFDLCAFMPEAFNLSSVAIPSNIICRSEFSREKMYIHGNATQIQQIIMNLMNNARDALLGVDQPTISVSLSTMMADQDFCARHQDAEQRLYVMLCVNDNGSGVKEEDLESIFDPFFTTKEVGKGTGLGLAMIYGAVQSHQGLIGVTSKPEQGTSFKLYFPLLEVKEQQQQAPAVAIVRGDGESILLVDDDVGICESHSDLLHALGYQVRIANNGIEACDIYKQGGVDLVIMDIVMPVLGGVASAQRIRKSNPDARIIFLSGYDRDNDMTSELLSDWRHVLSKPVNIEEFSVAIRRALATH